MQGLWPTRYGGLNRMRNTPRKTVPILSKRSKKGILILRCGVIRCVGGVITCAGVWELQLPYTAVFFISIDIISYEQMF